MSGKDTAGARQRCPECRSTNIRTLNHGSRKACIDCGNRWEPQATHQTDDELQTDGGTQTVSEGILDATAGGRGIWLDKEHDNCLFVDCREREPGFTGQEGRTWSIEPDRVEDFRDLPFSDDEFNLIVFDPPHLVQDNGMEQLTGFVTKSYGALHAETWQADIEAGFDELWRVLKPGGTLVFKFADNDIDFSEVLALAPADPLFGTTTKKTSKVENRWFVYQKAERDPDE